MVRLKRGFDSPTGIVLAVRVIKVKCMSCGNKTTNPKFCSRSCAAKVNNRGVNRHATKVGQCLNCSERLRSSRSKFCNAECQHNYERDSYIRRWLAGQETGGSDKHVSNRVRHYLYSLHGRKCWLCGWAEVNPKTLVVPVQIDHIDGDAGNNSPDNLRLLCPNCHSLTENFGSLNTGNGRKWRRDNYKSVIK